jgi:formate-dependent nitrite reductase complex subunit NrfG
MTRRFVPCLLLSALLGAGASPGPQQARIEKLEATLLAPCCYTETVSRHRSEVALQMKAEISRWVEEGKSDRQIVETYKQRYGAKVLIEPEGSWWWWMQVMLWAALAAGLAFTVWLIRRMNRAANSH